jgi:hypothetical protein
MQPADVDKVALYRELGFAGDTAPYERVLREAGLSRPERPRISLAKRERIRQLLEGRFFRICGRGDCQARGPSIAGERAPVLASSSEFCEICGGSADRAAIEAMARAFTDAGMRRLCIVGGSPTVRDKLARILQGRGIDLKLVEGTTAQTLKAAESQTAWADLVVIWGSSQLDHKVSTLYRGKNVITIAKRGLQELARGVEKAVESRR